LQLPVQGEAAGASAFGSGRREHGPGRPLPNALAPAASPWTGSCNHIELFSHRSSPPRHAASTTQLHTLHTTPPWPPWPMAISIWHKLSHMAKGMSLEIWRTWPGPYAYAIIFVCFFVNSSYIQLTPQKLSAWRNESPRRPRRRRVARRPEVASREKDPAAAGIRRFFLNHFIIIIANIYNNIHIQHTYNTLCLCLCMQIFAEAPVLLPSTRA